MTVGSNGRARNDILHRADFAAAGSIYERRLNE
jgi:hypothetical protein